MFAKSWKWNIFIFLQLWMSWKINHQTGCLSCSQLFTFQRIILICFLGIINLCKDPICRIEKYKAPTIIMCPTFYRFFNVRHRGSLTRFTKGDWAGTTSSCDPSLPLGQELSHACPLQSLKGNLIEKRFNSPQHTHVYIYDTNVYIYIYIYTYIHTTHMSYVCCFHVLFNSLIHTDPFFNTQK